MDTIRKPLSAILGLMAVVVLLHFVFLGTLSARLWRGGGEDSEV